MQGTSFGKSAAITVGALVAIFMLSRTFVASVPANHVGVEFNRVDGRVEPTPLTSGWHLIGFGTTVVDFPTFTQTYAWTKSLTEGRAENESVNFQVASGVVINADVSISYGIDPSKAPALYVSPK